jgi:hypothetical protein
VFLRANRRHTALLDGQLHPLAIGERAAQLAIDEEAHRRQLAQIRPLRHQLYRLHELAVRDR